MIAEEKERPRVDVVAGLVMEGKTAAVAAALEQDAALASKKDSAGKLLLHWAATLEDPELLELLHKANPEALNVQDDYGMTAVAVASSCGHLRSVQRLLDWGGRVGTATHTGQTPLHYAASRNRLHPAALLLQKGADVNAADERGATPLHRAASQGHRQMVHLLTSQPSVLLSPRDQEGNSPLHLALDEQRHDVADDLVRRGADLRRPNKDKVAPIEMVSHALKDRLLQAEAAFQARN